MLWAPFMLNLCASWNSLNKNSQWDTIFFILQGLWSYANARRSIHIISHKRGSMHYNVHAIWTENNTHILFVLCCLWFRLPVELRSTYQWYHKMMCMSGASVLNIPTSYQHCGKHCLTHAHYRKSLAKHHNHEVAIYGKLRYGSSN